MKSMRWGALAALVVAVVAVMGTATAGNSTASTELDLVIQPEGGASSFEDVEHDGPTIGDSVVARGPLWEGDTQVGRFFLDCTVVSNKLAGTDKGLWRCTYLLELPDGDLIIEGLDPRGPGSSYFAVTGGTEAYRTARGDAVLTDTSEATELHLQIES